MNLPDFKDFVKECLTDDFRDSTNEIINKHLCEMNIPDNEKEANAYALYSLSLLNRYHEWLKGKI